MLSDFLDVERRRVEREEGAEGKWGEIWVWDVGFRALIFCFWKVGTEGEEERERDRRLTCPGGCCQLDLCQLDGIAQ